MWRDALMLALGAAITWLCLHDHHRARVDDLETELRAAEDDLRIAGGSRRHPTKRLVPLPALPTTTAPTNAELDAWDAAVDGLAWRTWAIGMPEIDVRVETDPDGANVARIIPPRPSTGMIRRIVAGMAA